MRVPPRQPLDLLDSPDGDAVLPVAASPMGLQRMVIIGLHGFYPRPITRR